MPSKSLAIQTANENNAAIARLPEFNTLELSDDPEQIKTLITQIEAQANKEIASFVGAIEDQRFVMIGRCFMHLKSITEKGMYQEAIEELGYTYEQVKKQVKVTETYIKQALTRKKGIDAILGPGMLGTMGRIFNKNELKALGDGKKVHGLTDKMLADMTQSDAIAQVKAAKAIASDAIMGEAKTKKQLDKSHQARREQGENIKVLEGEIRLLTAGPENVQDVGKLADDAINHIVAACTKIRQMNVMRQSEKAFEIMATTMRFSSAQVRVLFDEIDGVKTPEGVISDADMAATFETIKKATA